MADRTLVAKLVRITKGDTTMEFSVLPRGNILVWLRHGGDHTEFTLNKPAVEELRKFLNESVPGPKLATELPTEPLPARKEHRTEEGLKEIEGGKGAEGMG